jgi:cation-transporting ATPase E
MHGVLKLFLTRVLYMALLMVMLAIIDIGFPFTPKQNALVTLLTVGIPTLALAAWARPLEPGQGSSSAVFRFVLPAACSLAIMGLGVYSAYLLIGPHLLGVAVADAVNSIEARSVARTALTTVSVLCGILLIPFAQPEGASISSWRQVQPKHAVLAVALLAMFAMVTVVPGLRAMFDLAQLSVADLALLTCVAVLWTVYLERVWRWQLLERLLGTTPQAAERGAHR